ncbi:pre-rRNA processing protein [Colletotrichum kahawae]|uniref:Pre-rRNA processing protein n=1 Tax=Colletotrichum kahawae TaxID=34407 RepID=A0AAD9YJ85_COLKA|nr:pre-rRNA processing protein [Colletotrichum kahawae]
MSKSSKNGKITDSRFSSFETDPRFRLPSKKQTKTKIDKRFAGVLQDDAFTATAKVDRYGRKIKSDSKKKALQRLYEAEDDEEEDEEEEEGGDMEVDADDVVQRELAKADAKYDPARGGGFSESESESESSDDDDDEEEAEVVADPKASMSRLRDEQAEVEDGEVTTRIAIVNLDWDNIKSADLFALFTSFLPSTGGRIENVTIYPSEFGKVRMQREELEGPPKEIFKSGDSDEESEEEEEEDEAIKKELLEEGDAEDFDSDALRKYQLDRLRYYYAVMTCSDKATAQKLYEATDGTEYQSSSNFLDLRFVPDDVTFDDEPRDECDKVPEGYKPVEFTTDALQHSKVKLTWDVNPDDAARKASINRAFTGSRTQLEENDLKAYLASDSEDDGESIAGIEEEEEEADEEKEEEPKLSKKELQRRKMREMLGLGAEEEKKSKNAPVGDMEITFTPALTETKKDKRKGEEETTIEKYKRKERERKEKRREIAKAKRGGADADASDAEVEDAAAGAAAQGEEDLGFDDPFFTTEEAPKKTKTSVRKEERLAKRAAREAEEKASTEQKAQLKLLMADDGDEAGEHLDHFDMNEILKAEKAKKKKGKGKNKKGKKTAGDDDDDKVGLQEGFKINVDDDRFKAVFESHEYAIDPSNPKFKKTEAMQTLLEEGRKKRKVGDDEVPTERSGKKAKKESKSGDAELSGLVASVKRKAKAGKK